MILTGALVNGIAIVAGGLAGTFGGKLMPERMKQTLLTAAALLAMGIGISGLSSSNNQLIPILSLILGTIVGELLNIEHAVERMGAWLQKKFSGIGRITEGFVTGTLVFAVGAMAVMGGLDSGSRTTTPSCSPNPSSTACRRWPSPALWVSAWPLPAAASCWWRGW